MIHKGRAFTLPEFYWRSHIPVYPSLDAKRAQFRQGLMSLDRLVTTVSCARRHLSKEGRVARWLDFRTHLQLRTVLTNAGQITLNAVNVLHMAVQEGADLTTGCPLSLSLSAPLQDHSELLRNV